MEQSLAQAITFLSLSYLPDAVCGCSLTEARYQKYRADDMPVTRMDAELCLSTFGVLTRGALLALSVVKRLQPIQGVGTL
jgi:hypothetical protein